MPIRLSHSISWTNWKPAVSRSKFITRMIDRTRVTMVATQATRREFRSIRAWSSGRAVKRKSAMTSAPMAGTKVRIERKASNSPNIYWPPAPNWAQSRSPRTPISMTNA